MSQINFDKIVDLMGDDRDMMLEMLQVFSEDIPEMILEIELAWSNNEIEKIKAPAHKLKSSVTWLNLYDTYDSLVFLEKLSLTGGESSEAETHLKRVIKESKQVVEAIKIKIKELENEQ
jgi:HPt (histidine-containing phosphotransfer) domain-containing protein